MNGGTALSRRNALLVLGTLAAPLRAQPTAPVVGFLGLTAPRPELVVPFLEGLAEGGYRDGVSLTVQYRWAHNQADRLAALAADLLRQRPAVLVTIGGAVAVRAAKAATAEVPVIFEVGADPVAMGLVKSLGQPGGNATGVFMRTGDLNGKRLQLLREMVPRAPVIAVLINHSGPAARGIEEEVLAAGRASGVKAHVVRADTEAEIDAAFESVVRERIGALVVSNSAFFDSRREQLVALAAKHALPTIYEWREFAEAGGLMSYGTDRAEAFRELGRYVVRVLKGAKPESLPVVQSQHFELVINRKTASGLGLTIPQPLLLSAAKVIE